MSYQYVSLESPDGTAFVPGGGLPILYGSRSVLVNVENQLQLLEAAATAGGVIISVTTSPKYPPPLNAASAAGFSAPNSVVQVTSAVADGQLVAYSATLGQWVPVNPVGQSELASASNVTGVVTSCSASGGVGAAVDIPGTAIVVPNSNGRPVTVRFQANGQQTVAGLGTVLLQLIETTSGSVSLVSALVNLPNAAAVPAAFLDTASAEFPIGVVTTPRSFKLQVQAWAPAANSPTVQIFNGASNPTLIRAVAG